MEALEIGMLAKSKAGHDKNKIYIIMDMDDTYVYLTDGRIRPLECPKKKKRKHIQPICRKHNLDGIDNVGIKRILKVFDKETRGE